MSRTDLVPPLHHSKREEAPPDPSRGHRSVAEAEAAAAAARDELRRREASDTRRAVSIEWNGNGTAIEAREELQ